MSDDVDADNPVLDEQDLELLRAALAVFHTPAGELVLRYLERTAGIRHTTTDEEAAYPPRPIDPVKMHIREGERRLYWKIRALITAAELTRKRGMGAE